jgi:hypothetical protein
MTRMDFCCRRRRRPDITEGIRRCRYRRYQRRAGPRHNHCASKTEDAMSDQLQHSGKPDSDEIAEAAEVNEYVAESR